MDDFLNTGKEKLSNWNDGRKKRNSEVSVTFTPKSGKRQVTNSFLPNLTIYQQSDGLVYFNKDDNQLFEFIGYTWGGPQFKTVIKSDTVGSEKGKTKRKGRIAGAMIGGLAGPVGLAAGALIGTHKKSKKDSTSHTETYEDQVEIDTIASVKVRNCQTQEETVLTFNCNTELNISFSQFSITSNHVTEVKTLPINNGVQLNEQTEDPIEQIKRFKELLELGVITQEEFDVKKKELLGL